VSVSRELLRWVLYWAAVLAGLTALAFVVLRLHAARPEPHPEIRHIVAGVAIDSASRSMAVSLPDDWMDRGVAGDELWYRFSITLEEQPHQLWALYLPTVHLNAAVSVNSQLIGDGGSFDSPVSRSWPRPLYFVISPDLLRAGENEIRIYSKTEPRGTGLLTDFYAGPDDLLQPAYRFRYALKAAAPTVFTGVLVILAVLLASITLRRRDETLYAWFGAILLALACYALPTLVKDIPVSTRTWDWFRIVSIGWAVVFITIFTHRLVGVGRPRVERSVAVIFAVSSVAVAFVPGDVYYRWVARMWGALCIGWGVYPCAVLIHSVLRERKLENLLLLLSGLALLVFGGRDALMQARLVPRVDGFLIHYTAPVLALIFTWILLSRFVDARRETEQLNLDLERRVREKTEEIEVNYRRLRVMEQERALTGERERIMRDMHDGLGGHLIGALALAERGGAAASEIASVLRQARDDLRLVIRSFEPSGDDPAVLLGGARKVLERQIDAAGLALRWEVTDTRPLLSLGPRVSLHVLRIVQEAVTNAVRHSRGTQIAVRISDSPGEIWIEVDDDGNGIDLRAPAGRGLANMRSRAHQIGAAIEIGELCPGTRVRLRLPADRFRVAAEEPVPSKGDAA
jgi:signal transduction histidine kinase